MKFQTLILLCFMSMGMLSCNQNELNFAIENNTMELKGYFSIPEDFKKDGKMVVIIPRVIQDNVSYHNMYTSIAKTLNDKGIACFYFENRAFKYPEIYANATLNMQVDDGIDAIKAIKNIKKFKDCKIGVMGVQEGSSSSVILASKSDDVNFLVLLNTPGISGFEQAIQELDDAKDKDLTIDNNYVVEFKDNLKDFILEGAKNEIKVVYEHRDPDTIKKYLDELVEIQYNSKLRSFFFENKTLEEARRDNKSLVKNPQLVEQVRYDPRDHFNKIKKPVFVVYTSTDEVIVPEVNINRLKEIFEKEKIESYKFKIVSDFTISEDYEMLENPNDIKYDETIWEEVGDWINNIFAKKS